MGIGRREFVRLASIAIGGLTVSPLQSVVAQNDLYLNRKLGIMFHKPAGWRFVSVKDFGDLKKQQKLDSNWVETYDDPWEELPDPVCIATKYDYEDDDNEVESRFSPTISLQVSHRSEFQEWEQDYIEDMSVLHISDMLRDFKVIKYYPLQQISGCPMQEIDTEYLFEHEKLPDPLLVQMKVYKINHNGFFYDFSCHQSEEQGELALREFEMLKKSIRLI